MFAALEILDKPSPSLTTIKCTGCIFAAVGATWAAVSQVYPVQLSVLYTFLQSNVFLQGLKSS